MRSLLPVLFLLAGPPLASRDGGGSGVCATSPSGRTDPATRSHAERLVEWIRSYDTGYFHPDLTIRNYNNDPGRHFGMFVADDKTIPKGTTLMKIPAETIIDMEVEHNEYGDGGECATALVLAREMKKARKYMEAQAQEGKEGEGEVEKSQYQPYLEYLIETQSRGQIPSAWSPVGKKLLQSVVGYDNKQAPVPLLPPDEPAGHSWVESCGGKVAEVEEQDAYMLVLQRGWDDLLIPVYDMSSHRNGDRWLNTKPKNNVHRQYDDLGYVEVLASQDIPPGGELYTTYNFCEDCQNRFYGYGTPEILRDYGFVEQFPQRWFFPYDVALEIDSVEDEEDGSDDGGEGGSSIHVTWLDGVPEGRALDFLNSPALERMLKDAARQVYVRYDVVPPREGETILQYFYALTQALEYARKAANSENYKDDEQTCLFSPSETSPYLLGDVPGILEWIERNMLSYDFVVNSKGDPFSYHEMECTPEMGHIYPDYIVEKPVNSHYQAIEFFYHPETKDTCFQLDTVVQICDSYRPHYHETVVHHTARFLPTVKRVVFVGGGDSMLLHEILKYPSLETVVGLELDQLVTRMSFRYFGTQPHFDDPRVEWWFGDAARSLLMLPKDYFGTFDLVLVDLSETVMSMSVTKGLDIFGALSLLLQPEGIIIKNELYFDTLGAFFPYAAQLILPDVPVVCSQALTMASYENPLLVQNNDTPVASTHPVQALYDGAKPLQEEEVTTSRPFNLWNDYIQTKNERPPHPGTCRPVGFVEEEPTEQDKKSPGVMMILEVEEVVSSLEPSSLKDTVTQVLAKEGLSLISSTEKLDFEGDGVFILAFVCEEGYMVARAWPEHHHVGFDLHLWSSFAKHNPLKDALVKALQAQSSSSYRIVAGGMLGCPTWKEDEQNRGPRVTQSCDSSSKRIEAVEELAVSGSETDVEVAKAVASVWNETLHFIKSGKTSSSRGLLAVVVCGDEGTSCESLKIVEDSGISRLVLPLFTCSKLSKGYRDEMKAECEQELLTKLQQHKAPGEATDLVDALVLDPSASYAMAQIAAKMFTHKKENRLTADDFFVLSSVPVSEYEGAWRTKFLDRFRHEIGRRDKSIFRGTIRYTSNSESDTKRGVALSFVSAQDPTFIHRLRKYTAEREDRSGFDAEISIIKGPVIDDGHYAPFYQPPQSFLPKDFDNEGPLKHFLSQNPAGFQTVFQLEPDPSATSSVKFGDQVNKLFEDGVIYSGFVTKDREDGTYDILYEDGDDETRVHHATFQKIVPVKVGDKVNKAFDDGHVYVGTVVKAYKDGTYDIVFDEDGQLLRHVQRNKFLRFEEVNVGDQVKTVFEDGKPYVGTITEAHKDGTFDITYADGDTETHVLHTEFQKVEIPSIEKSTVRKALTNAIMAITLGKNEEEISFAIDTDEMGDGLALVTFYAGGSVVVLWDGRMHIDVNLFSYKESPDTADAFLEHFLDELAGWMVVLRDVQPRGFGRVVNFSSDLFGSREGTDQERKLPHWAPEM